MKKDVYCGFALIALLIPSLFAQEAEKPVATLSVKVNLVNVYVTVRDKKGAIVPGLQKDDFAIAEDGRAQSIRFFSHESDLPLTLGLLVDTSPSEFRMIETEREASRQFFDTIVRPEKDKAFLIHFDRQVELLQDLTSSRVKLEDSLKHLEAMDEESDREGRRRNVSGGDAQGPRRGGSPPGGGGTTHLFDAVYLASQDVLRKESGRKAIVILGDGDDMGSKITKDEAIRAAQQADVIVYCVRIADKDFGKDRGGRGPRLGGIPGLGIPGVGMGGPGRGGPPGGGPGGGGPGGPPDRSEGKKNLELLAQQTGGAFFEVSKKLSLGEIFSTIEEELRSQYSLGYTPDAQAKPGYRKIQVSVKQKGLKVQARDGYYTRAE